MRFNGIGTMYLGARPTGVPDERHATLWFTFFFAPLIPLRRVRVRLLPHKGDGFSVRELERTALVPSELLRTWAFSLVFVPVVAALLFALVPLVQAFSSERDGLATKIALGVAFVCFGAFLWKLMDWHQARFLPNGK